MVGTVTGVEHPTPCINGTADRFRRVGARIVLLVGGVPIRDRASPRTGSGVPRVGPLIIRSQTGVARRAAGVIRNLRPRPCFSPPYEISYRAVKLPRVCASFGDALPAARSRFAAGRPKRSCQAFSGMISNPARAYLWLSSPTQGGPAEWLGEGWSSHGWFANYLALASCVSPEELRREDEAAT